jgi:hypothetical protein
MRAIDYKGFTILDTDKARAVVDSFLEASKPSIITRVINRLIGQ